MGTRLVCILLLFLKSCILFLFLDNERSLNATYKTGNEMNLSKRYPNNCGMSTYAFMPIIA